MQIPVSRIGLFGATPLFADHHSGHCGDLPTQTASRLEQIGTVGEQSIWAAPFARAIAGVPPSLLRMSDVLDASVTIKQSVVDKEYGRFALLLNRAATRSERMEK